MNEEVKKYLDSGLAESYVLGLATPEDRILAESLVTRYPEFKFEIETIEKTLEEYYLTLQISENDKSSKNSNLAENRKINLIDSVENKNTKIVKHVFTDKFKILSTDLSSRLDSLHWSKVHKGSYRCTH